MNYSRSTIVLSRTSKKEEEKERPQDIPSQSHKTTVIDHNTIENSERMSIFRKQREKVGQQFYESDNPKDSV